jgi:G6PDH family F420-dependent oxidoreductase
MDAPREPRRKIGYFLSCEEYPPEVLVEQAKAAQEAGFESLWISDHIHPWNDEQGNSPFVWTVIGALSQVVDLPVMTAVTCPTVRQHPLLVAHAAATCARMLEGRFILGVGTGEALNEHVLGGPWPSFDVRLEMLEEAVGLIRELWEGGTVDHHGPHYTVDDVRLYSLPDEPPPIYVSGFGPKATEAAAVIGDGYVATGKVPELAELFAKRSGGKPAVTGTKVAWAATQDEGVEHAHRLWATAGLPGELAQVLPSPRHFEQAATLVTPDAIRDSVVAGPDVEAHVQHLLEHFDAGYDAVHVANMGPHWRDMIAAYGEQVLPEARRRLAA